MIINTTEILWRLTPKIFFIWLINLRWWPSFRKFAIINLRGKDRTPWNHESLCPQKFLQLRSTNYQTRRKIVWRYASINFVSNYYFLYNQKVYLQRSKYLILPFVLESGLSITKSPQLPHLTFHGHKNSFFLVPDLIFIWSPLTTLEPFFSENPKKNANWSNWGLLKFAVLLSQKGSDFYDNLFSLGRQYVPILCGT